MYSIGEWILSSHNRYYAEWANFRGNFCQYKIHELLDFQNEYHRKFAEMNFIRSFLNMNVVD